MPALSYIRDSEGYTTKRIAIGPWDMDTNASVNIAHGLSGPEAFSVKEVKAMIYTDGTFINNMFPLDYLGEGSYEIDYTNIVLTRVTSGHFDSVTFNSTTAPADRGWVEFKYKPGITSTEAGGQLQAGG